MKHRMQIMQELWEYNLTTNSKLGKVYATNEFTIVRR